MMQKLRQYLAACCRGTLLLTLSPGALAATEMASADYLELSLEQLMSVDVTSVAGTPEPRFTAPAALTVISGDDIRRAGHRSIAEAMRMVPGMHVARRNSMSYAIGTRGLTGTDILSSRYLVLVDGRVTHDPLLSATLWDVVDVAIEDIERIEVIRGPGATLWGSNAMNGVINVISRSASQTQGTLLSLGAGDLDRIATLRHGVKIGSTAARAYIKYADHSALDLAGGGDNRDAYSTVRLGVRADGAYSERTRWTMDANLYNFPTADMTRSLPDPMGTFTNLPPDTRADDVSGGHFLVRAVHDFSPRSGLSVQAYYDQVERDTSAISLHRNSTDLDLRHWTQWNARNEFIWGLQFTQHDDQIKNSSLFVFDPTSEDWNVVRGFVQNTTEVLSNRLFLMLGSKITHHDFVDDVFLQPGARLWYTPSETQTWWAAVSRPVRVPSRLEESGQIVFAYADTGVAAGMPPTNIFQSFGLSGNGDMKPEELVAYELGHRHRFGDTLTLDVSAFYNDYQRLIGLPPGFVGSFRDQGHGKTYGGEIVASYRATRTWQIDAAGSLLLTQIDGPINDLEEDGTPRYLGQLRSSWRARGNLELNSGLYYVSHVDGPNVPAYTRFDMGLSWDVKPGVTLALWGQNLADAAHAETDGGVEIPRTVYAQLRLDL